GGCATGGRRAPRPAAQHRAWRRRRRDDLRARPLSAGAGGPVAPPGRLAGRPVPSSGKECEFTMQRKLVRTLVVALGLAAAGIAQAQVSDDVVRLGVMNDMAGPYSDVTGVGSVIAAEMAGEDFRKESGSKLKIEVISADHQNKADLAANSARKWYAADEIGRA